MTRLNSIKHSERGSIGNGNAHNGRWQKFILGLRGKSLEIRCIIQQSRTLCWLIWDGAFMSEITFLLPREVIFMFGDPNGVL